MDNTQANIKSFNTRLWLSGGRDQAPEGAMRRCVNAAPELTGSVYSRYGSVVLYPIAAISLTKFDNVRYQYDGSNFYRNGVVIDSGYNGHRLAFVKMPPQIGDPDYLFVTGGGKLIKIDSGGTITNWGIQPPPNSAQVQNLPNDQIVIDAFNASAGNYVTSNCTIANNTTVFVTGTASLAINPSGTMADLLTFIIKQVYGTQQNWATYTNGDVSLETDIFQLWLNLDNIGANEPTSWIEIDVDVHDGTFMKDWYSFAIGLLNPNANNPRQPLHLTQLVITFQPGQWQQLTWPKSAWVRHGDNLQYDWSSVKALRFQGGPLFNTSAKYYLDNFTLSGGSGMGAGPAAGTGGSEYDYYIVFRNLTTGSQSNPNASASRVFGVSVNKTTLSSIPLSTDIQVGARDLYRTAALNQPGGGAAFYVDTIYDNVTTTYVDQISDISIPQTITPWQKSVSVPPNAGAPYYIDGGNGYYFKLTIAGITGANPPQWIIPTTSWSPISDFVLGETTSQPRANGVFWLVTTAGVSGLVEPNWNQAGPINDGTVIWTSQGLMTTADNSAQWTFHGINSTRTLGNQQLLFDNTPPQHTYADAVGPFQGTMFWCRDITTGARGRVYFSPPGRPESVEDFITVTSDDDPTQKLVIWDENLYVITTKRVFPLFPLTAADGSVTWTAGDPILGARGTSAPFSVVSSTSGVTYQGPDGPRYFTNGGNGLVAFDNLAPIFRGQMEENVFAFTAVIATQVRGEILWSDTNIGLGLISPLEQFLASPVWRMVSLPFTAIYYEADDNIIVASWGGNTLEYEVPEVFVDGAAYPPPVPPLPPPPLPPAPPAIKYDLLANIPPSPGMLDFFYATDTGQLFVNNGAGGWTGIA